MHTLCLLFLTNFHQSSICLLDWLPDTQTLVLDGTGEDEEEEDDPFTANNIEVHACMYIHVHACISA